MNDYIKQKTSDFPIFRVYRRSNCDHDIEMLRTYPLKREREKLSTDLIDYETKLDVIIPEEYYEYE